MKCNNDLMKNREARQTIFMYFQTSLLIKLNMANSIIYSVSEKVRWRLKLVSSSVLGVRTEPWTAGMYSVGVGGCNNQPSRDRTADLHSGSGTESVKGIRSASMTPQCLALLLTHWSDYQRSHTSATPGRQICVLNRPAPMCCPRRHDATFAITDSKRKS